ncbi:MAG TPA: tRNA 2-thiouridine(34) synthase MnmA, partial [Deltaproteobacteria bacterium]|nr:tRNA 2-thiouridine(34) synthase MnmA [Deltaproteobacteria bacterium]
KRLYVVRLDPEERRVVVGDATDLDCLHARVDEVNWISGKAPRKAIRARVQVRHRHVAVPAEIEAEEDGAATIRFDAPVRAVAPGQAAVFYDEALDEEVIGGGWITAGTP